MYIQADQNGVKTVPASLSWRLFHANGLVIHLYQADHKIETGGTTEAFVAATREECEAEIARLDLEVPSHLVPKEEV
jgi:hypothetical protein